MRCRTWVRLHLHVDGRVEPGTCEVKQTCPWHGVEDSGAKTHVSKAPGFQTMDDLSPNTCVCPLSSAPFPLEHGGEEQLDS